MIWLFVVAAAYLIGSIPFGFLAGKLNGVDIRDHGSGNIGATNVFRIVGKRWGIGVFILDFLKGLVPVIATFHLGRGMDPLLPLYAGIATILGHNYPCWLKFKGGKGIATSGGVLGGLLPWALLAGLVTWLLTFAISRYVSLASIFAGVSVPVTVAVLTFRPHGLHYGYFIFACVIGVLAVWRHRSNIERLRAGTEHRFTRGSKS